MCFDYKVNCRRTLAIMMTTLTVFISSRAGPSSAILRSMWSKCCCTAPGCQPECSCQRAGAAQVLEVRSLCRNAVCVTLQLSS